MFILVVALSPIVVLAAAAWAGVETVRFYLNCPLPMEFENRGTFAATLAITISVTAAGSVLLGRADMLRDAYGDFISSLWACSIAAFILGALLGYVSRKG